MPISSSHTGFFFNPDVFILFMYVTYAAQIIKLINLDEYKKEY